MKCNTCVHQSIYIGSGAPDDYSVAYCSKKHWENEPPPLEEISPDPWSDCKDFEQEGTGPNCCGQAMHLAPSEVVYECRKCGYWCYTSS